jgi:carbonic anhydrase
MQKIIYLTIAALFASSTAYAGAHWEYSGEDGPDNWSKLSPEFTACATGKNQSPVDLKGAIKGILSPITFDYKTNASEIINNGHTIQANYASGSTITVDGVQFELKQFHFHAPSENLINSKSYPMELHLVHADKNGNLAVVAVMFKEGDANPAIAELWKQMPKKVDDKNILPDPVNALKLLPKNQAYFRFNGSLTTPPCSEGVRWMVMKTPVTVSHEQLQAFENVLHHANNRPVQPVNARPIIE